MPLWAVNATWNQIDKILAEFDAKWVNLFSTGASADQALADWLRTIRSLPKSGVIADRVLTNDQKARRRIRHEPGERFKFWEYTRAITFSVYRALLPPDARDWLDKLLDASGLLRVTEPDDVTTALKDLSVLMKTHRANITTRWQFFVDLGTLQDYRPRPSAEAFNVSVREWLGVPKELMLNGSEEAFLEKYRLGVRKFLGCRTQTEVFDDYVTREEWVLDPMNWARQGSSDGPRLEINVNGKVEKAKKTKWASALKYTKEQLLDLILSPRPMRNRAAVKRELTKARAIVACDNSTYLKMGWLERLIRHVLKDHPNSTLWSDTKDLLAKRQNMYDLSMNATLLKVPLDQEEFDHTPSIRMQTVALEELKSVCLLYLGDARQKEEVAIGFDQVINSFNGATVRDLSGKIFSQLGGISSGMEMTALLDTIVNASELEMVRLIMMDRYSYDPVVTYYAQGDDDRLVTNNIYYTLKMLDLYSELGFKINPRKFFIATDADEYLRITTDEKGTTGYMARAIPSLCWRNPVNRDPPAGSLRLSELMANWATAIGRGACNFMGMMVVDMARSNKIKKDEVMRLLATPASLGGLGYLEPVGQMLRVEAPQFKNTWSLQGSPPILDTFPAETRSEILKSYASSIHASSGGVELVKQFTLKSVQLPKLVTGFSVRRERTTRFPTAPRSEKGVRPSVAQAYNRISATTYDESETWDEDTKAAFKYIKTHANRDVLDKWLSARLSFNVPVVPGIGNIQMSTLSAEVFRSAYDWFFNLTKMTGGVFRRLAYTVEVHLREAAHLLLLTSQQHRN